MMKQITLTPIGRIVSNEDEMRIDLDPKYAPALNGLEGFSHVQVLWWFDHCDNGDDRAVLTTQKPYTKGPETLGIFATRSPQRPNPIAVSTAQVTYIDRENASIGLCYIDGFDGTPVLDIKPYTPSLDRVENPSVPEWCAHWPCATEESGAFDWESEFNF